MSVAPESMANASAKIAEGMPVITDSWMTGANFFVQHPVGILSLCMTLTAFGFGLACSLVRGRRRRK